MPSLKDFIEAMSASWPVALAICLGSSVVLACKSLGVSYLASAPAWLFAATFFAAVLSGSVLAVSALRSAINWISHWRKRLRRERLEQRHVEKMSELPATEQAILLYALAQGTQVFAAPMNHRLVEPLIAKGYLCIVPGVHDMSEWPHIVPEHIWRALNRDRERLLKKSELPDPFAEDRWI